MSRVFVFDMRVEPTARRPSQLNPKDSAIALSSGTGLDEYPISVPPSLSLVCYESNDR